MRAVRGVALFAFTLVLAIGCGAAPARPARERALDYASLVIALRAGGADVRQGGMTAQPFMPVVAHVLSVDGATVQVFELASEATARAQAALIAPDASIIGSIPIAWLTPARFYRSGRAIVLYLGDDARVLAHLERVLGDPIAAAAPQSPKIVPAVDERVPTTRV